MNQEMVMRMRSYLMWLWIKCMSGLFDIGGKVYDSEMSEFHDYLSN